MKKICSIMGAVTFALCLNALISCNNIPSINKNSLTEEDIKDSIEVYYRATYDNFELIAFPEFSKNADGYKGVIEFSFTKDNEKYYRLDGFNASETGTINEVPFTHSVRWEDHVEINKIVKENLQ